MKPTYEVLLLLLLRTCSPFFVVHENGARFKPALVRRAVDVDDFAAETDDVALGAEALDVRDLLIAERIAKRAARWNVAVECGSDLVSVVAYGAGARCFVVPTVADAQRLAPSLGAKRTLVSRRPPGRRDRFPVDFALADSPKSFEPPTTTYARVSDSRRRFLDKDARGESPPPLLVSWRSQKMLHQVCHTPRFGGIFFKDAGDAAELQDAVYFLASLVTGPPVATKKPPYAILAPFALREAPPLVPTPNLVDVFYLLDLDAPPDDFLSDDDTCMNDDFASLLDGDELEEDELGLFFDDDDDDDDNFDDVASSSHSSQQRGRRPRR